MNDRSASPCHPVRICDGIVRSGFSDAGLLRRRSPLRSARRLPDGTRMPVIRQAPTSGLPRDSCQNHPRQGANHRAVHCPEIWRYTRACSSTPRQRFSEALLWTRPVPTEIGGSESKRAGSKRTTGRENWQFCRYPNSAIDSTNCTKFTCLEMSRF